MKKFNLTGYSAAAALMLLTACNDGMYMGDGTGTITPFVSYDPSVVTARSNSGSRAAEIGDITVDDLTLTLTADDGSVNETFLAANFPTDKAFTVGKYTMTASYGDPDDEGFEKPAVYGEAQLSVNEGKATQVSLTATPSKAMVSLAFDEALLNYMSDISARLQTAGGTAVDYPATETRPAYLKPGNVTLSVDFTKPNGKSGSVEVATFSAEARYHYHMAVKLGGDGAGTIETIVITFDDNLQQEEVIVDISDLVLSTPAPEVTPVGFTDGELFTVVEGSSIPASPRFNINARGGIAKAVLTTRGQSLLEQGWPAEIDLANASASQQALLTSMGLKDVGLFRNPGKMAAVELGDVAARIPATVETASPVEFSLVVTDKNGKASEPVGFSVKVDRLVLELSAIEGYAYAGEDAVDVLVAYNGTSPLADVLTMQYENVRGIFADATIASVASRSRAPEYTVSVNVPSDAKVPLRLQAKCGAVSTDVVEIPSAPAPVVSSPAADVFATHAWVTVSGDGYDPALKSLAVQVSTDGKNFTDATATQEGAVLHVSGLTPGAQNYVRVKMGSLVSEPIVLTTEAATQIPNSDMETFESKKPTNIGQSWPYNDPVSPWASNNADAFTNTSSVAYRSAAYSLSLVEDRGGRVAQIRTVGVGASTTFSSSKKYVVGELFLGTFDGAPVYGVEFSSRPSALTFVYKYAPFGTNDDKALAEITVYDAEGNVVSTASESLVPAADYTTATVALSYAKGAAKAAKISVRFRASDSNRFANKDGVNSISGGNTGSQFIGANLHVDDVVLVY